MIILYKNKAIKEQFSSEYKSKWRYPERVKKKLIATRIYIESFYCFMDIANYIPFHLERLKGNLLVDGDIISKAKYIEIVMVTEVSNHYE